MSDQRTRIVVEPTEDAKARARKWLRNGEFHAHARETLLFLSDGHTRTHEEIAAATGRQKGNCCRELAALGYIVQTRIPGEARRHYFTISDYGQEKIRQFRAVGAF